jgi:alpha-beta hydrolase superfamily lysophospholipase
MVRQVLFAPTRRELVFHHADSRIVGDLHLPPAASAEAPVPAVVGSGPAAGEYARNWEDIGARLAAVGIAYFGYDKPGCGESTGDYTGLTLHDRAQETLAAVAAVAAEPEIVADRIGLLGGSQGGWVAPLAAVASDRRVLARLRAGDDPADVLAGEIHVLGTRVAELAEVTNVKDLEFFARIADYDPIPALENLRCPILAIFGADDVHVPTRPSVAAYEAAFAKSGHNQHQIVVFPGADHRILVPNPADGRQRRAPGLFELIATWLARTLDG